MKKILYIFAIFAAVGCSDFLSEDTRNLVLVEDFCTNELETKQALNGIYKNLNNRYVTGDAIRHVVTDLTKYGISDDGSGLSDYTFGADNKVIGSVWSGHYSAIKDCNVAISAIEANRDMVANYERYIAQARGVRAYLYFNLVRWYGDVPLVTKPVESLTENLNVARTDKAIVFQQIIDDFDYCAEHSMDKGDTSNGYQWGLMTSGAAKGFLSKVYLWLASVAERDGKAVLGSADENYQKALNAAAEVIEGDYGTYSLIDYYPDVFSSKSRNEAESELMFATLAIEGDNTGSWTGMMFGIVGTQMVGGSWSNISSSDYQRTFYETADDVRRLWNCPRVQINASSNIWGWDYEQYLDAGTTDLSASKSSNNFLPWCIGKFRRIPLDNPNTYNYSNFGMNEPILRYADVLLTYAEACNEITGNPTTTPVGAPMSAFDAVNEVRKRAAAYIDGAIIHEDIMPRDPLSYDRVADMEWSTGNFGKKITSYPTDDVNGKGVVTTEYLAANCEEAIYPKYSSDYEAFRSEILNERAREFVAEGSNDRWCDLVRRGLLEAKMKEWLTTSNPFIAGALERNINYGIIGNVGKKHYQLPIPLSEMDSNKALVQNSGY